MMTFWMLFVSLSVPSFAAPVTEKCLKPFEEALNRLIEERIEKKPVPVECQYYKFSDLEPDLQKKIRGHISPKALEIIPGTPLSSIYGTMVNGSSLPGFLNAQCTEIMDEFDKVIGLKLNWGYCTGMYDKLFSDLKFAGCLNPTVEERLRAKRDKRCDKLGGKPSSN